MKVFVDLDDTAAVLSAKWLAAIKEHLGEVILPEEVTAWDRLAGPRYQELLRTPGFFRDLPVKDGAAKAIESLNVGGHVVYILSAGAPWNYSDKAAWVQEHLPLIDPWHIVFTASKGLLAGPDRLLIDDAIHNLEAWERAGGIAIAFDRPWNRDWKGLRITEWYQLRYLVQGRVAS